MEAIKLHLPLSRRWFFGLGILVLVIVGTGMVWYYITQQPESSWVEMTGLECRNAGGRIANTLDSPKEYRNRDVIGKVTGLLCPCVCVKE